MRYRERAEDERIFEKRKLAEMFVLQNEARRGHPGAVDRSEDEDQRLAQRCHELDLSFESTNEVRKIQEGGNMRKCFKCGTYLAKDDGVRGVWKKHGNQLLDFCHKCRPDGPADSVAHKIDQLGPPHSASLFDVTPETERTLVNRPVPRDDNERWVAETQTRIATLDTLIAAGEGDAGAMSNERARLRLQLSLRTTPARLTNRAGAIEPTTPSGLT
jgi:hypothetical protein